MTNWITVTQAAEALKVDTRAVRRLIDDGTLICREVSPRRRYVDAIEVLELIEKRHDAHDR